MSIEELLKPRYKVIADYPDSCLEIGEILRVGEDSDFFEPIEWWDKYPHLFRKMAWWEDRDEKDMPEYVSFISLTLKEKYGDDESKNRKYLKITSWRKGENGNWFYNNSRISGIDIGSTYLPATREEYEQYIKQSNIIPQAE